MSKSKKEKKEAMQRIRTLVKRYMNGDTMGKDNLGQLPQSMEDAVRVIIALQDMLEKEKANHQKASDHIRGMRQVDEINHTISERNRVLYENTVTSTQKTIDHLQEENDMYRGMMDDQREAEDELSAQLHETTIQSMEREAEINVLLEAMAIHMRRSA